MEGFDRFTDTFNSGVRGALSPLDDPMVRSALTLFLVLYGGLAAPAMPIKYKYLFDNIFFRVAVMFLILWIGNRDPAITIAVAVAFIATMNVVNKKTLFERFEKIEHFEGPKTSIFPGCMNLTVYDLLESFKNDKKALLQAMLVSKVPGDVKVTDYYAPLIGTYLLNRGFTLKAPCTPPGVNDRTGSWTGK